MSWDVIWGFLLGAVTTFVLGTVGVYLAFLDVTPL